MRGSIREGVLASDKCAVDAVCFDGGDRGAVLLARPYAVGALSAATSVAGTADIGRVAGGRVRRACRHGDGIRRYGEVVVADKAVVGGGPFGAASAVECGEVELVDFHGVVIAEPERIYIECEFSIKPCLHAAVLVAIAGRGYGVRTYFVYNAVPGAGGELFLRDGAVQVPLEIVAVYGFLPHEVDELHGVAIFAPHDAGAPAVAGFGHGVPGVALAAAESGEFAAELELESVFEEYVVGAPHGVGGFYERLYNLRGAGGGVVVVRAHATLGVFELQHVAVFLAVIHDPRIFAIVLVHGVPPAFVVVVALEVFFGLCVAVHANAAVFEVHERNGVGHRLCVACRCEGCCRRGSESCCQKDVLNFCTHAFKIIFFRGY